mgnify:CR=1 FL=1
MVGSACPVLLSRSMPRRVSGGDHDGVIDVCTHLDGADHQIAQVEQRRIGKGGEAEVDPDGALDDQDQQNGHVGGLEGEQQHHQHDEDGHDADHLVVHGKGFFKVVLAGHVTGQIDIALRVILAGDLLDLVRKGVGGVACLQIGAQIDQDAVVILALQLGLAAQHLLLRIVQGLCHILVQRYKAGVQLVAYV